MVDRARARRARVRLVRFRHPLNRLAFDLSSRGTLVNTGAGESASLRLSEFALWAEALHHELRREVAAQTTGKNFSRWRNRQAPRRVQAQPSRIPLSKRPAVAAHEGARAPALPENHDATAKSSKHSRLTHSADEVSACERDSAAGNRATPPADARWPEGKQNAAALHGGTYCCEIAARCSRRRCPRWRACRVLMRTRTPGSAE
jgi:hypothetical protein